MVNSKTNIIADYWYTNVAILRTLMHNNVNHFLASGHQYEGKLKE